MSGETTPQDRSDEQRLEHLKMWCREIIRLKAKSQGIEPNTFLQTYATAAQNDLAALSVGLGPGVHMISGEVDSDDPQLHATMYVKGGRPSGDVGHLALLLVASRAMSHDVLVTAWSPKSAETGGPSTTQAWLVQDGRPRPMRASDAAEASPVDGTDYIDAFDPDEYLPS
ncbi:hypothetical protein [Streptomyces sp. NBC_01304]|uniref:hypothetical protein n=1 Tax=Streptomyces sp. NBC_01304 TaxID=2903818 RepID=UPI002E0E4D1C|nr:hypothetical protein OG430_48645 [Streptomyces sp. NBC_01304]